MESTLLARLYETWWRPLFVRAIGGSGEHADSFAGEYFIHKQCLGLDQADGPWLDLSCGPGLFVRAMAASCPGQTIVGTDISAAMLETAAPRAAAYENVELVRADAHELPFRDKVFAGVNNAGALHVYRSPEQVFREVHRILRVGGVYVGSTFREARGVSMRRGLARLVGIRTFDPRELAAWLSRVGFRDYEDASIGDVIVFKVRKP